MYYEAIYALNTEIASDLAALRNSWKSEHDRYYAVHHCDLYIKNDFAEHAMRYGYRDQEYPEKGLTTSAGYCDSHFYNSHAPEGAFRWLTCGGNLTRYDVDVDEKNVRILLIGARHGLRMPPNSIQSASPLRVIKYETWRKDVNPFEAGLNPYEEIDKWPVAKKIRWLVENKVESSVKLWQNIEIAEKLFKENYKK